MISTSEPSNDQRYLEILEHKRDRLQRLLQNATGEYALRFDFGPNDRLGEQHLVLGMDQEMAVRALHSHLVGAALHLLGHYLNQTTEWWPVVRREEDQDRPHFLTLWHALEDSRIENRLIERWPGADKFLKTKIPPDLSGNLVGIMSPTQQIELALYLEGRGFAGAAWTPTVASVMDEIDALVQEGAAGVTPRATLEAMFEIYPSLAPHLRGEDVLPKRTVAESKRELPVEESTVSRTETIPEIEPREDLVSVGLAGRMRDLPQWLRPGSAPWFERGLGGKEVHPSAVRPDRETIVPPPAGDPDRYQALLAEVRSEAGQLLRKMTSLMREEAYLRYRGQYRTGSLNTAKLWRQRLGIYRLFQRQIGGQERQVAFTLLVDESASMKAHDKYELATKTAILLGETLNQLDVPLEIIGFSTAEYEAQAALRLGLTPAHKHRTTRCSSLEHRIYKRFDEPFALTRHRLAGIEPRNNNWDEEHLLFGFKRTASRQERRKIIVVISDGQPNGDAEHLIRMVRTIESMQCKVIGIGIGSDFVERIYPEAIVVSDFRQLTQELMQVLINEFDVRSGRTSSPSPLTLGLEGAR